MDETANWYKYVQRQEGEIVPESTLGPNVCQQCGFAMCICNGPDSNTYWNNGGKYQDLYDALWFQVPREGKSERQHIELVRNISRLYHDMFNNGFGNLDVLMNHWRNLCFWHIKFCGDECSVEDFKRIDSLFDDWMDAYDDDIGGGWFESEMIQRGIWGLMEKLCNAVILYVGTIEGLTE